MIYLHNVIYVHCSLYQIMQNVYVVFKKKKNDANFELTPRPRTYSC